MITQDSKNSCGKAIIQQYILYTQHSNTLYDQYNAYRFPSRWTTPAMIRKIFTFSTNRNRKRHKNLSREKIQEYINIYKTPLPVLWLVTSAKNPHKKIVKKSSLHWLHYYLLIWYDTSGFIVYNPFGYEETISYAQRSHLFAFTPHPDIARKRYEKMLYYFGFIKPSMILLPQ